MLTDLDLLQAIDQGEALDYEFKSAKGGIPRSMWETYSAMANSIGGVIVLGVEEVDVSFHLSGLDDPAKIKKNVWDNLQDRGKVSANLCADDDVQIREAEGKSLLVMRIPQASRRQRPVHLGPNPLTGTYRRHETGDYKCSADEVGRMLADQSEEPADSRILEGFDLSDLDATSIAQYRRRFSARVPDHPWLVLETTPLLEKLGGWRRDRSTGQSGLTFAGLLMFGKDEALRDPHALPKYHVDYQELFSEDPAIRWTDRLYPDGTWTANVFQFYQEVILRLSRGLQIPFQLEPNLYRKDETLVHEAIRETLVNALIHADYRGIGGVIVRKSPSGIELSNPGSLLVSLEQLHRGGISECRNKSLQLMFQMIGGGEKAGSGVDKIMRGWNSQQWLPPSVNAFFEPDRVQWRLPFTHWLPEESIRHLDERFGEKWKSLTAHERLALVTADTENAVTNARLQLISDLHPADITKTLRGLVNKGFLLSDGPNRRMKYRLPEEKDERDSVTKERDSVTKERDSVTKERDSVTKERDSVTKEPDSSHIDKTPSHKEPDSSHINKTPSHKEPDSSHIDKTPSHKEPNKLDPAEIESLRKLAYPQGFMGRVPDVKVIQEAILRICEGRYLTTSQLSMILRRNINNFRNRYLSSMVDQGKLRLLYPAERNHPNQAYTTAENATLE